ncbi:MAG: GldG family protein [Clostridia bacterium]|nr:GldG family protein [Clostridia bacterium]
MSSKNIKDPSKSTPWYKKRSFKTGALAATITAVFIAVIVVLNIILSVLGNTFSLKLDMTSDNLFTMSKSTEEAVKGFDKKIEITSFLKRDDLERYFEAFAGNTAAVSALDDCVRINPNISMRYIDLNTYPDLANEFNTTMIGYGNVLCFACGKNQQYAGTSDFYVLGVDDTTGYNYDSNGSPVITGDQIERCIIKNLLLVTSSERPKAALVSGHDEVGNSNLPSMITESGVELAQVKLLIEDIPAGTDFILIPAPTTDYSLLEIDKLNRFLERQGSNSIVVMLSATQGDMPNLDAFLNKWGIDPREGVIEETDSSSYASGMPELILTSAEAETESFIDDMPSGRPVLSFRTRNAGILFEQRDEITVTTLIRTFGTATVKYPDGSYGDKDTYPVLTRSAKYSDEDGQTYVDAVYVFMTPEVFNDDIISTYSGAINNESLGNAMINSLTYRTVDVDIPDRNITDRALNISQSVVTIIGFYLFTIIVPLSVLIAGFVVWIKRRRL